MNNAVSWDVISSSYITGIILALRYRDQPVIFMQEVRFFTAVTKKDAVS
jgi:hypothetical protein